MTIQCKTLRSESRSAQVKIVADFNNMIYNLVFNWETSMYIFDIQNFNVDNTTLIKSES